MSQEVHVRFREGLGVRLPRATRRVVLVSGTYEDAVKEKECLARYLKETASLVLSEEKTHITATDKVFEFLAWIPMQGETTNGIPCRDS